VVVVVRCDREPLTSIPALLLLLLGIILACRVVLILALQPVDKNY
jgi:hypothetical protein